MKRLVLKGSTNATLDVFVQDSSATDGSGLTGLVFNSSGLVCYYRRGATGSATALTLATQTVGGAHTDGGFVEIDATNMPGLYRLDLSDAIVASGVPWATVMLKGATNMAPVAAELQLTDFDPEDGVRLGLTALPNAAAEAAGGLYTRGTGAGQVNQDANGRLDANLAAISTSAPAADRLELSALQIVPGTVDTAGFAPTTTEFEADDVTEATADHYNGRIVIFTSGALAGQATDITDYSLATGRGHFTVTAMTEAPANDDAFIVI